MTTEQNAALFETRRQFLGRASAGIGSAALASLLNPGLFASAQTERVGGLPGFPNFAPKAKRVIYLFQNGFRDEEKPSTLNREPSIELPNYRAAELLGD